MSSLQTIDTETVLQLFDDHIFSQKRTVVGGVGDYPLVRSDRPGTSGIHRTSYFALQIEASKIVQIRIGIRYITRAPLI